MLSQQLFGKHLQIYWEFIQEFQIVLSSLKERNSSKFFNLYHSFLKERKILLYFKANYC